MFVMTKISKDSPPAGLRALRWADPGRPWDGSRAAHPGGALGSPTLGATQAALQFNPKNSALLLKASIKRMQSLTQTALEGVTWITKGAERAQGEAGLGSAATWGCKPGGPLPPANPRGRRHAAPDGAVGKARKPLSLGVLGNPGKVHPGDSYQTTTLLLKKPSCHL